MNKCTKITINPDGLNYLCLEEKPGQHHIHINSRILDDKPIMGTLIVLFDGNIL